MKARAVWPTNTLFSEPVLQFQTNTTRFLTSRLQSPTPNLLESYCSTRLSVFVSGEAQNMLTAKKDL